LCRETSSRPARQPPIFLKPGDLVELEVEKIGLLRNHAVDD
jgi:2-keto-4-pentenoate hydratase/2-oxohepta-3-ene-1,7-dioic acid hydratase in catechol pathway